MHCMCLVLWSMAVDSRYIVLLDSMFLHLSSHLQKANKNEVNRRTIFTVAKCYLASIKRCCLVEVA